jgi:hypothetical protein
VSVSACLVTWVISLILVGVILLRNFCQQFGVCVRKWRRAGFSDIQAAEKSIITDREIELFYGISTWDDELNTR